MERGVVKKHIHTPPPNILEGNEVVFENFEVGQKNIQPPHPKYS